MGNKGFLWLVAAMLVLGVALGSSFIAGLAVGKDGKAEAAEPESSVQVPDLGRGESDESGGSFLDQLRTRIQSGDLSQEELGQLRQQFGGRLGQRAGGAGGLAGGTGLRGTVESIEGDTVTLNTAQGPLQVAVGPDTTIRTTADIALADLVDGMTLTVTGERGEDGTFQASTIFALPEGAAGSEDFGGGGFGGGRRGGGGFGGP